MKKTIMRNIFIVLILIICGVTQIVSQSQHPTINIGEILHRSTLDTSYSIVASNVPIILRKVKSTCSCVKVFYDKKPVKIGDTAVIRIKIRALDKGYFYKTVDIDALGVDFNKIVIRGNVR